MSEPAARSEGRLPLERWGRRGLAALQARADRGRTAGWAFELLMFGLKQAWACVFGAALLALLILTHRFYPPHAPVSRYDALVVAALLIQIAMLGLRLESWEEARVILAFHLVGTVMEVFKTGVGSWSYPEAGVLRVGAVPLFSGFMYASVGSYLARVWRTPDLWFTGYPSPWTTWLLAGAVYVNFFSHHYILDLRWPIFAATAWLFRRTRVWFTPDRRERSMPLLLGFLLVALFIWFAENIATFSHAWVYPNQRGGWAPVPPTKLGSWFLLTIVSFVLVASVHRPERVALRPAGS